MESTLKSMKKQRGITLIALVTTIVVLLILAGVTINLVLTDGGIFSKAEQAKLAQTLAEYKDKIEIARATVATDKNNLGKVPLESLKTELENMGMAVTETEENAKLEVTVPGIEEKIEITPNGNNVDIKYPDNITAGSQIPTVSVGRIILDKENTTLVTEETLQLTATLELENAINKNVIWTSSDTSIATVSTSGVVTAKAEGNVTITAKTEDGEYTASSSLYVLAQPTGGQIYLTTEQVSDLQYDSRPYLPTSNFEVLSTENTLEGGLVIQEKNTTDQYVWIEVPKTIYENTTYNSDGTNKPANNTETAKIEECLKQYTVIYRNNTKYKDSYTSSLNNSVAGGVSVFDNATAYNNLKNKMLASVYDNGGFWIGRYEAGIETARTAKTDEISTTLKPLSQPDKEPFNYITRNQAQDLATRILPNTANTDSTTSSLMFGVQWDLVLRYLEVKEAKTTEELNSDSRNWGNYTNYDGPTVEGYSSLTITGKSINWSANNIYDLAGNVSEWTLERNSDTSYPCAARGGGYSDSGLKRPASYRRTSLGASSSSDDIGLRVALY